MRELIMMREIINQSKGFQKISWMHNFLKQLVFENR